MPVVVVCGPGPGEGSVRSLIRESLDESIELHADITEMVAFLIRAYQTGAARVRTDDTGFRVIDTDHAALAAILRELRPVPPEQWGRWVAALGTEEWGEAMAMLRYLRPPDAVPALIDALFLGAHDTVRRQAATMLGDIGDDTAISVLATAAGDPRVADAAVRALASLAQAGHDEARRALHALVDVLPTPELRDWTQQALDFLDAQHR